MIADLLTRPLIPLWLVYVAALVVLGVTIGKRLKEVRKAHERLASMKRQQIGL